MSKIEVPEALRYVASLTPCTFFIFTFTSAFAFTFTFTTIINSEWLSREFAKILINPLTSTLTNKLDRSVECLSIYISVCLILSFGTL